VKKKRIYVLIPVCVIIIIIVIMMFLNPLFLRSEKQIERYVIRITPIGMSIEDVINTVRNETSWKTNRLSWIPLSSLSEEEIQSYIYGRTDTGLMWLLLGRSLGFNSITATWIFDENGELINVTVKRQLAI